MRQIVGNWPSAACGRLILNLNRDALVGSTAHNAPSQYRILLNNTGMIPAQVKIYSNEELRPEGTQYLVTFYNYLGEVIWGPQERFLCGISPVDLSLLIPDSELLSSSGGDGGDGGDGNGGNGGGEEVGQVFLNLEREADWARVRGDGDGSGGATTGGDNAAIGTWDPQATADFQQHVSHLGQNDCIKFNLTGGPNIYSDVLFRYPAASVLPQPPSGLITLTGMLAVSASSMDGAQAIEIDTMLSQQNVLYNMSSQISYSWLAGRFQVNNPPDPGGAWIDTDINLGRYEPDVWHTFVWEYSWDAQRQISRKIAFTFDGMRYAIPTHLATVGGVSQPWAPGILLQLQMGANISRIPWSTYYCNVHYIYGRPIRPYLNLGIASFRGPMESKK